MHHDSITGRILERLFPYTLVKIIYGKYFLRMIHKQQENLIFHFRQIDILILPDHPIVFRMNLEPPASSHSGCPFGTVWS